MELYELRPDTDAFRPGWSLLSGRSRAALHTKAMVFDREAVFIGSFNLDPRSAVINTEAGLYIESPELAERLTAYMATGVVPANSYRVLLDPNGEIVWETVTGRPNGALPGRARNRLPPALRRRPVEAPADRLATLTDTGGCLLRCRALAIRMGYTYDARAAAFGRKRRDRQPAGRDPIFPQLATEPPASA